MNRVSKVVLITGGAFGLGAADARLPAAEGANLVLFLASEESRQITGTHIVIDNGETVG